MNVRINTLGHHFSTVYGFDPKTTKAVIRQVVIAYKHDDLILLPILDSIFYFALKHNLCLWESAGVHAMIEEVKIENNIV